MSTAALATLLLGGCGSTDTPEPEPVDPPVAGPRPAPDPPPAPPAVPDEPVAPPQPPEPDERIEGATFDYEEPPRADDVGAHRFTATATTRDERLACISQEVTITAVDAGPESSDRRIASTLLAEAELLRSDWESEYASEADCLLLDGTTLPRHGTLRQRLVEQPCELPGGPPLRCFTLEQDSFGGGANVTVEVDQFIFGATDGHLIGIEEVLALVGIDHQEAEEMVGRIACLLDGYSESCIGRPGLPRGRPTADGLVIEYGKGEAGAGFRGARTLFVPWVLLGLRAA